jgi:hypothetical protein
VILGGGKCRHGAAADPRLASRLAGGSAGRRADSRRRAQPRALGARRLFRVPRQRHHGSSRTAGAGRRMARLGAD